MSDFWSDLRRREKEFHQTGKKDLRHGISSVGVSSLAQQFYCEHKVENEFLFGEVPTEAKEQGTALHDELLPQKPISDEDFVKLVSQKKATYAVLPLWGKLGDIRVIGMPDHIIWTEGKPRWLVELKTTSSDPTRLWDDQRVQIVLYGALLEQMGFNCSNLKLALIRLRASDLSKKQKQIWVMQVSKYLQEDRVQELEANNKGTIKVHLIKHDLVEAEAFVQRKQDYWLHRREPTSSTSFNKCRACEYRSRCPKSLYRF